MFLPFWSGMYTKRRQDTLMTVTKYVYGEELFMTYFVDYQPTQIRKSSVTSLF